MAGVLISGLDQGGATRPVEVDENGNLRVDLVSGVSVSTVIDQTNSLAVYQTSGTSASVNVVSGSIDALQVSGSSWSVTATSLAQGLNETNGGVLRTVLMTDSVSSINVVSGFIDALQVSGVAYSVSCLSAVEGKNETTANTLRVIQMTDSISSVNVVSGSVTIADHSAIDAFQLSGSVYSVASQALGLNETNDGVLRAVLMTDSTSSVNIASQTSSLDIKAVSGATFSTQVQGIARQTNPTAAADAAAAFITCDDLGRTIMRPIQARDLIATAYATLSNGTEATLATAAAGTYLDLIYVMCTNDSDAAVTVDLRAVSAGSVLASVRVPANGTAGVALPVPFPMSESGNSWTADMPDITATNVNVSALFSKEV